MSPEEVQEARARYADCESQGEMLHTYKEEHICFQCAANPVCVVAHATLQVENLAVAVRRCMAFTPSE